MSDLQLEKIRKLNRNYEFKIKEKCKLINKMGVTEGSRRWNDRIKMQSRKLMEFN